LGQCAHFSLYRVAVLGLEWKEKWKKETIDFLFE
jgi:hypothetical protein